MWPVYLACGLGSGMIGIALLGYRAAASEPVGTFPAAAVGFVGAGAVNAVIAASVRSDDGATVAGVVVLTGVLTVVIGIVATLFSPRADANDD